MFKKSKLSIEEILVLVLNNVFYFVVDHASFKKTSEMTKGKEFRLPNANFEIDHCPTNECKVLCSFISIFVYGADSLFVSRPLPDKSLKEKCKLFL